MGNLHCFWWECEFNTVAVVQSPSHVWLSATPWAACRTSLFFTISQSLSRLMSIESVMPSNHLILCCPLLYLLSIFPSIRVFFNKLTLCIRWPNYWSFSFSTSFPMNIQGWFPLGLTGLISLLSKGLSRVFSTTVRKHQFFSAQPSFMVQLSHPCMTTGKTIAFDWMDLCWQSDVSAF